MKMFTLLADLIVFTWIGLNPTSRLGGSIHFFIEDISKIFVLLFVMVYLIAILRGGVDTERIRYFLKGKSRFAGYLLAALFGAVTPFCSCSSIPLFLGFTAARIPLGITMAFLVTSPMINEVAVVLLGSILGLRFTIIYIVTGMLAGVFSGWFIDTIKAERYLTPLGSQAAAMNADNLRPEEKQWSFKARHEFASSELKDIIKRVWKWVFIGVGLGAVLHGFVPEEWVINSLGEGQWWSVPAAVILGIPLYANASGVIPVAETLLAKGLPTGTALAFMMSIVAASFPEFMMLKQVMKPRLLLIFFLLLLCLFTIAGWIFNLLHFQGFF